jgi:hypothetical protein
VAGPIGPATSLPQTVEGSETLAFKTQAPGKYPKENILHNQRSLFFYAAVPFTFYTISNDPVKLECSESEKMI